MCRSATPCCWCALASRICVCGHFTSCKTNNGSGCNRHKIYVLCGDVANDLNLPASLLPVQISPYSLSTQLRTLCFITGHSFALLVPDVRGFWVLFSGLETLHESKLCHSAPKTEKHVKCVYRASCRVVPYMHGLLTATAIAKCGRIICLHVRESISGKTIFVLLTSLARIQQSIGLDSHTQSINQLI